MLRKCENEKQNVQNFFLTRHSNSCTHARETFCTEQAKFDTIDSMALSPFHGIFSSLGQNQDAGENDFSLGIPSQPLMPLQQAASTDSTQQIGRVAVDIFEQDDYYIIKAPIAGVRLSDLDIEVNDNVLTIRGSRRQTDTVNEQQYYLQECFWGPFSRSVTLPIQIDPKKVRATFNKECVLKILVPKE